MLDKIPKRELAQAKPMMCSVPLDDARKEAEELQDRFLAWCRRQGRSAIPASKSDSGRD